MLPACKLLAQNFLKQGENAAVVADVLLIAIWRKFESVGLVRSWRRVAMVLLSGGVAPSAPPLRSRLVRPAK